MRVEPVQGNELYERYPGQTEPQGAQVYVDAPRRVLGAEVDPEIGNAVPMSQYHGHVLVFAIPPLREGPANELLNRIEPLAERVCDGYESAWDGQNEVGEYDDDAQDAIAEIVRLCERAGDDPEDQIVVWDAEAYLESLGGWRAQAEELGIRADSTDEDLRAVAEGVEEEARENDVDELEGLLDYLEKLREYAREEEEE